MTIFNIIKWPKKHAEPGDQGDPGDQGEYVQ